VTVLVAHWCLGMYGISLAALGMLSPMTMGLTMDAYGVQQPAKAEANAASSACARECQSDAGSRPGTHKAAAAVMEPAPSQQHPPAAAAEMSGQSTERKRTAAIGKGFAIGSAALVSLVLFGAYTADIENLDVLDPWTFIGLLLGAMILFAFSAKTTTSVGNAAAAESKDSLAGSAKPGYDEYIRISPQASLKEILLVMSSPLVAGVAFGKNCTAGLLTGGLVSGVQMAISMNNTGSAWDKAKKYIEAKNAVIVNDTIGPAITAIIVMKLIAMISLILGSFLSSMSNAKGGPKWFQG